MTFLGYLIAFVVVISLWIGYRIFLKIAAKKEKSSKSGSFLEKAFLLFFISLLMISVNALTFVLSYSFFWEKAFRTFSEPQFEAAVVGYKSEVTKSKNFSNSTYSDKVIFFPKVEYINSSGKKITKTLDMTSNHPPEIGEKVKITDSENNGSSNAIELNWILFIFGSILIGLCGFFAALLSTFITDYAMKRRLLLSAGFGFFLVIINLSCILFIYSKQ